MLYLLSCFAFILISPPCFSEEEATSCEKVEKILYLVKKMHFQSPEFDKAFAAKVVENYLFYIDGQCLSLYDNDILSLKKIQNQESTPKDILCKSYDFLSTIFEKRLKETDSLINSCKNKKYVWNINDSISFNDSFVNNYSKNVAQKTRKIDDYIKLHVLRQLELKNKLSKGFEFEKNDSLKTKAVFKMKKGVEKKINDPNGITSYLEENLLQAIISTCDPHSDYFTTIKNKQFKESLSTTVEIYGFSFEENKNEHIEITSIKPGSPAWKCNNLNVGDQVTKIEFLNEPQIDVSDYDIYEFNNLLYSSAKNEMNITVLKKSGAVLETHLTKAIVKSDDNTVNGYVLSKKYPIGYISLPSFYTDFAQNTPFGCANDVAKEIIKLKEDNIQGLILDLRNNGGGSVEEAVNLAGIFIDAAPLFIEKVQSQKPRVVKDVNRGAIYTGPLIILINKGSASASELLAQMLKTQQRAIVVGSSSFGKATGQIIIPLDTSYNMLNPQKVYSEINGYIKITVEKLYDLPGTTYQKMGVVPHIPIPDLWSSLSKGEKGYSNALSNDPIDKKVKVDALPDSKISICSDLSANRIKEDRQFKRVVSLADTLHTLYEKNTLPLHPLKYGILVKKISQVDSIIEATCYGKDTLLTIRTTQDNKDVIKMDEFLQTLITSEINNLNKDIILREAYYIITDYNSN